jgi:hypothetical protein
MAVVVMAVTEPFRWQNGVWTATPVCLEGSWGWALELHRGGRLAQRRVVKSIVGV